ncbi:substrate-binding domain-containing protein [Bradyrhizobium genosp. P]|uniref:substrate-binding domain-containing protein n=1 Tax=Bradyrhizobium genosp. P TaxID=83641 RepID=UPI003CEF0128
MDELHVIISGGFSLAYHNVLPEFERMTGITVTTLSGASQGTGPKTIKYQLEQGADIDVVILSKEGLEELIARGRIADGSEAGLATAPLGAAVRRGSAKPDISSVDALKQTLLDARLVALPGSTSGLFVKDELFPKLAIAAEVSFKVVPRGTDSTAMLAAGEADLAIGPLSELVDQPGIDLIGPLPASVQLVQVFTAAIVNTSHRVEHARRLIAFLTSDRAEAAIKKSGMEPVRKTGGA